MNRETMKRIERLFQNDDVTDEEFDMWVDLRSKIKYGSESK